MFSNRISFNWRDILFLIPRDRNSLPSLACQNHNNNTLSTYGVSVDKDLRMDQKLLKLRIFKVCNQVQSYKIMDI